MQSIRQQHPITEEQSFLQQFADGNFHAFGCLWQTYRNYLYNRCLYWMGGNSDRATEALDILRLKAWDKLPKQVDNITDLKVWFTRLTDNTCIEINQQNKKNRLSPQKSVKTTDNCQQIVRDADLSLEDSLADRGVALYICAVIDRLPDELREPFARHYYYQKECREIAIEFSLSEGAVRKRIRQARHIFNRELKQYLGKFDSSALDPRLELGENTLSTKNENPRAFWSFKWLNVNFSGKGLNLSF